MKGKPSGFWGKLHRDQDGTVLSWHPLVDHCADVAACFETLLRTTTLRARLARLAGIDELGEIQIQRLVALAALHDIGKFNPGFQAKALGDTGAGHVREVLYLFGSDDGPRLAEAIDLDHLATWGNGEDHICRFLIASICHHGRPLGIGQGSSAHLWKRRSEQDPFAGIQDLLRRIRVWCPAAFAADAPPLPDEVELQHAFSGLVMLADWLGSDTNFFPFSETEKDRMAFARQQAREVLRRTGIDPGEARSALQHGDVGFSRICRFDPRPAQKAIDELEVKSDSGLTILEAETGSGKTEAALAHFVRLLRTGVVDGMYFALPTRTAATQIQRRVASAMKSAFPDHSQRPPVVLGVPGYITVDDQAASRLASFEVLWNDHDPDRWRARGWAAENTKRYLAGAIVVGTIDQVLLSALQVSHSHLRASALLRQLLVVDEVHASDAYMNRILEQVLRRHLHAGGHALLMSATLGASTRERFLALNRGTPPTTPNLEEAVCAAFPQLVLTHGRSEPERIMIPPSDSKKEVVVELKPLMGHPRQIATLAIDAARAGARVLVLRNLVRDALTTQRELEAIAAESGTERLLFHCAGKRALHHSRFAKVDREALDDAIEDHFGKQRQSSACVAVATQTVQQSLDLDADLMLTDLCPLDVLLQRVGRLHRHRGRTRPTGFEQPRLVVLTPAKRDLCGLIQPTGSARGDHGLGTVYEDLRIIEASWRTLKKHAALSIPTMNRVLVEESTHPEVLSGIAHTLGKAWVKHGIEMQGIASAHRSVAVVNMADWEIPFGDSRCAFPSKLDHRIQTRLGEEDRRLSFNPPMSGVFSGEIHELTLPARWARNAAPDAPCSTDPLKTDGFRIRFAEQSYLYDRWGLRPEATRDPSHEEDVTHA